MEKLSKRRQRRWAVRLVEDSGTRGHSLPIVDHCIIFFWLRSLPAEEDRSRLAQNFNFEVVHTLQFFSGLVKQALMRCSRSLLRSRAITLLVSSSPSSLVCFTQSPRNLIIVITRNASFHLNYTRTLHNIGVPAYCSKCNALAACLGQNDTRNGHGAAVTRLIRMLHNTTGGQATQPFRPGSI